MAAGQVKQLEEEVEYREKLRAEEKEAREAAEQRLSTTLGSLDRLTSIVQEVGRDVLRGQARD